jgi:hypothetical protein
LQPFLRFRPIGDLTIGTFSLRHRAPLSCGPAP